MSFNYIGFFVLFLTTPPVLFLLPIYSVCGAICWRLPSLPGTTDYLSYNLSTVLGPQPMLGLINPFPYCARMLTDLMVSRYHEVMSIAFLLWPSLPFGSESFLPSSEMVSELWVRVLIYRCPISV